MAEGVMRDEWMRTSWMLSAIHNVLVTKESQLRQWYHFNPFYNGVYDRQVLDEEQQWEDQFDPDDESTWMKGGGIDADDVKAALAGWGD